MKKLLPLLAWLVACGWLPGAEDVPGGLIAGATWTADRSPYRILGHLEVAGLTIEPGVRVETAGDFEIVVNGRLTAIGTVELPIVFTAGAPATGWMGLRFQNTPDGSELRYCRIERATNSGIRIVRASPEIARCTIADCSAAQGGGLNVDLGIKELVLDDCVIENNWTDLGGRGGGIYSTTGQGRLNLVNCRLAGNRTERRSSCGNCTIASQGGGVFVASGTTAAKNCVFVQNRTTSIGLQSGTSQTVRSQGAAIYVDAGTLELTNCVFGCNSSEATVNSGSRMFEGSGLYVNSGTGTIVNCSFASNSHEGIRRAGGTVTLLNSIVYYHPTEIAGTVTATYCCIQGGFTGIGNIADNPVFASGDRDCSDLRIVPPSPCIDAGNPDPQYNDVCFSPPLNHSLGADVGSRTRNDIGGHGGPGACNWPGLPDCNANSVSDTQEIAEGPETDCNRNGLPDSCDLASGTSRDSDQNGVPDDCQGRSVELVRVDFLTWHLVVQSDVAFTACEFALAFDPRILALLPSGTVTAGPDLPAGGQLLVCPGDCATALDFSACGSLRGFTVSWVDTTDPIHVFPAGRHRLFTLRLDALDTVPAGECSPLVFVDCIRRQGQPAYNVIVGAMGESIPLFPIGTEFCPLPFRRGDSNDDGRFDIADAVLTLLCLFAGGPCSQCPDAADANDDGALNVTDPIFLLNWRFRGGPTNPPPPPPFPSCNRDPSDQDALADCVYLSC